MAWVRQTLEEKLGRNTVRKGGLAIHTTLDPKLQDAAHKILTDTMSWTDAPAAALVSINPRNGQVLAMDASVPYSKNAQFNIPAEAYRQVGSTFKMFTLTTSIADGYNPNTTSELSAHLSYLFPNTAVGPDNPWVVDTASDSEELNAPRTIADATAASDNTVFARLAIDLGAQSIVNTAHKMGIPRSIDLAPYPSITLGVSPVSPLWMTAAYSTLAADGVRHDPQFVSQIDSIDSGKTIETFKSKGRRVLTDGVAYEANKVLEGPICCGTAAATAQFSDGRVESGKTGTTNDYKDAWFCGYTPNLTTCVWMGYPKGEITLSNLNGHTPFGGDLPATMWRQFMEQAFALEPKVFPPVYDWPLPKHPVQWIPFHSQFPTYVPCGTVTPTTGASGATVTTTGSCPTTPTGGSSSGTSGGGGGKSNGNSGGNGGGAAVRRRPPDVATVSLLSVDRALELIRDHAPRVGASRHPIEYRLAGRVLRRRRHRGRRPAAVRHFLDGRLRGAGGRAGRRAAADRVSGRRRQPARRAAGRQGCRHRHGRAASRWRGRDRADRGCGGAGRPCRRANEARSLYPAGRGGRRRRGDAGPHGRRADACPAGRDRVHRCGHGRGLRPAADRGAGHRQ